MFVKLKFKLVALGEQKLLSKSIVQALNSTVAVSGDTELAANTLFENNRPTKRNTRVNEATLILLGMFERVIIIQKYYRTM